MKSKREDVDWIKNFQNKYGISRNYFNEIRKNKSLGKSIDKHLKNPSIFFKPIFQKRKVEKLKKRISIRKNNSPKNNLKMMNKPEPQYSPKRIHQKMKSHQNDSDSSFYFYEYKNKNELLKQKSNGKKNNYKNRIGVNNKPNHNIIFDINDNIGSLNVNKNGNYNDDSHSLIIYMEN